MLLLFIPFTLWLLTANCADHEVFKNCSSVPFCSKFRNHTLDPSSQFTAKVYTYTDTSNIISLPLYNDYNETVKLQVSLLRKDIIRIRLIDHTRYELVDVLDEEPTKIPITDMNLGDGVLRLSPKNFSGQVVIKAGPPFTIDCYYGNILQVRLNGDRFVMENTDSSQAFAFGIDFPQAERLYGLYHHAYQLALGETVNGASDPFRLRNSDMPEYEIGSTMALYSSIPVVYGHSANYTSGIFLHNAAEQWVDASFNSTYFMVESGAFDLFVLLGPGPKEVVRQYTSLTGVAHMPQLWTLGYHQSRFSYYTQEEVKYVVAAMDAHDFPMDAIWLDIDYTDEKKYFTWNPENFSDPIEMQRNLSSTHRKLVATINSHLKVDHNYPVYMGAANYYVKWPNGSNFQGNCWPGLSSYLDFLNTDASDYYANLFSYDQFNFSTETLAGIWNNMNEPMVFNDSLERTLPFETHHHGNVLHRDVHNIYGMLQTKATHQGLIQRDNGTIRPFILTRSHFAGSQRYAATWTGDNTADWQYLAISYSECLVANILEVENITCATRASFFLNSNQRANSLTHKRVSLQLLQRWYQAGAWLPFYRSHSNQDSARREPYVFSENSQKVIRDAIKLRYKHIPVWYTLFYEHTRYGDPLIRPIFYHYTDIFDLQNQLLLGSDIMVRPVLEPNVTSVSVIFPGLDAIWYRVDDDSWSVHNGNTTKDVTVDITSIHLYYKAGSIIARKDREKSSTTAMFDDPYTVYVNLDSNNTAEGRLYLDDYTSFNYSTNNSYLYMNLTYITETHGIHFELIDGDGEGFFANIQQIIIHTPTEDGKMRYQTTSDGTPLYTLDIAKQLQCTSKHFFLPL